MGNEDGGNNDVHTLSDADPAAQVNQWVPFPDLEVGQSITQDVVFPNDAFYSPGNNPRPKILFESAKPQPASSAPATP